MRYFSKIFNRLVLTTWLLWLAMVYSGQAIAQEDLLRDRWQTLETPHFVIYSQLSSRQTERFATEMEAWRQVVGLLTNAGELLPVAAVPNYVFLFSDSEGYEYFSPGEEQAFFASTPRSNFMALLPNDADSLAEARHHYVHFLVRNFLDLRLPRWYEEALAGYLSRMQIEQGHAQFDVLDDHSNNLMADLSESIGMGRLLFRDDALASPRLVQIANLKSHALLRYLLHAYEEEQFVDRRENLAEYLRHLMNGRNPRFAYDQAFDVTHEQLDAEFHNYLRTSSHPAGSINHSDIQPIAELAAGRIEGAELAVALGELALNFGNLENALVFFQAATSSDANIPRSYSGTGDALRFLELEQRDQVIASYFERAIAAGPNDVATLLDYGEYWESELGDCEKVWPAAQRSLIVEDIRSHFGKALQLAPDNPEANLAMGQLYLFDGEQWSDGLAYQDKAFAALPGDGFIMEQSVEYAIAAEDFASAERLISEMAQPIHFWREPSFVIDLRNKLHAKQRGLPYEKCQND